MSTWAEDITTALEQLNGISTLAKIYETVEKIRAKPHPVDIGASVRQCIERNSPDSKVFAGKDLFFSVHGIGEGVWGLRSFVKHTPVGSDINDNGSENPKRVSQETYRILRDTQLARELKLLYKNQCQICGKTLTLLNGETYAEAHHIRPLGGKHKGPDILGNIMVLCPNDHALLDCGGMILDAHNLNRTSKHRIETVFIDYHNQSIVKSIA